jgi:nodulation protein E
MTIPRVMPNAAASQVCMRYGCKGPSFAISSACSSGSQSIGVGFQMVRCGVVDRAVVGGSEALLTPAVFRAWEALRVLTPDACRPFSKGRNGMVLGEGAAVLIIEELETARARNATIIAEIAGYGSTSDANDIVRPDRDGPVRSMRLALADAGLAPEDVGYINAHGTGTILNDIVETAAVRDVFGACADRLAVTSTKPIHGHTLGAAGAIELVVTIKALAEGVVPPTVNWIEADPKCDLDVVPNEARRKDIGVALSNSFAFGGINASLVVRHVD